MFLRVFLSKTYLFLFSKKETCFKHSPPPPPPPKKKDGSSAHWVHLDANMGFHQELAYGYRGHWSLVRIQLQKRKLHRGKQPEPKMHNMLRDKWTWLQILEWFLVPYLWWMSWLRTTVYVIYVDNYQWMMKSIPCLTCLSRLQVTYKRDWHVLTHPPAVVHV